MLNSGCQLFEEQFKNILFVKIKQNPFPKV